MKPPRGDEGPTFRTGDRVMVDDRHYADFWANGVIGTVATPPEEVQSFAPGWDGHVRMVSTVSGVKPYYWIVLDEPRLDNDGDGPYGAAEIAASSLKLLT